MDDTLEKLKAAKMQVIKCKHGKAFAFCADGFQDDEWFADLGRYVAGGCTVSLEDEARLEKCECEKTQYVRESNS